MSERTERTSKLRELLERIRDLDEQTSDGALGSLARYALDEVAVLDADHDEVISELSAEAIRAGAQAMFDVWGKPGNPTSVDRTEAEAAIRAAEPAIRRDERDRARAERDELRRMGWEAGERAEKLRAILFMLANGEYVDIIGEAGDLTAADQMRADARAAIEADVSNVDTQGDGVKKNGDSFTPSSGCTAKARSFASWPKGRSEMAHGDYELAEIQAEEKCERCGGRGRLTDPGRSHGSAVPCSRCSGTGMAKNPPAEQPKTGHDRLTDACHAEEEL